MAEESIGTARIDVVVNTDNFDAAITSAKRSVTGMTQAAQDAYNKLNTAEKRRVDSLIKQADTLGFTRQQQILYNAALKNVPTAILDELKTKLSATATAQTAMANSALVSAKGFSGSAKTAKELQFAMRGLPAQITDIGVSLASGQRPLMVFLQQGGQLKDMFGGIRPAAAALGRSLLALVNPFTVSAAAAVGLFAAWKQGSDEAVAFNKALITTGNYAGLTADQLQAMSASLTRAGVTQHAAAATLAEVAASGKFTATQIQLVGSAALSMSKATGQATSETIKQFQELGEKPVEAILKLNDSQHFLTSAIYEQIKALEDQGRAQDAAKLAMQTYADALNSRSKEVVANAGLMEQAWAGITGAAKSAWDAMLDVGRPATGQEKFDTLRRQLDAFQKEKDSGLKQNAFGVDIDKAIADTRRQLGAMQTALVDQQKQQSKAAAAAALVQIEADSDREAAQFATNQEKLAKAKLAAHNKANDDYAKAVLAGDMKLAQKIRDNEARVVAGLEKQYAEKTPRHRASKADPMSALNSLTDKAITQNSVGPTGDAQTRALQAQVTQLQAIAKAGAAAIEKGADLAKVQAQVAVATENVNQKFAREADQLKQKNTDAVNAYKASLQDMLETRKSQVALQVASIGMGQKEASQQEELIRIDEDYNRKKASLLRQQQNSTSSLQKEFFQEQIDALDKYHADTIRVVTKGWAARQAAEANGMNGVKAAIADFLDDQKNSAAQAYRFTQDFIGGLGDAFADFASGAKSAKDAFGDLIDDMYKQALRFLANKAIQKLFESFGNSGGGGGGASTGGGGWGSVLSGLAGAFSSSGARAIGGPVSAGGMYRVNERGPELLEVGGKNYLMMGKQSGNVNPSPGASTERSVSVNQTIVVQGTINSRTSAQIAQDSARRQRIATSRNG